jgi:hypothetical protein
MSQASPVAIGLSALTVQLPKPALFGRAVGASVHSAGTTVHELLLHGVDPWHHGNIRGAQHGVMQSSAPLVDWQVSWPVSPPRVWYGSSTPPAV